MLSNGGEKTLDKAELAVAAQAEEIANQQAKLVQLQAVEDAKREEIRALIAERCELSQRLARLKADQVHGEKPFVALQPSPLQTAIDCLNRSYLGLLDFQEQSPEIYRATR